jgi:hypothetical protein
MVHRELGHPNIICSATTLRSVNVAVSYVAASKLLAVYAFAPGVYFFAFKKPSSYGNLTFLFVHFCATLELRTANECYTGPSP